MDWDPEFAWRTPMLEPFRDGAAALRGTHWPALPDLERLLAGRDPPVVSATGAELRVVPQGRRPASWEERYEARVFLKGELQVRERNWHDLLNLLVWLAFPRAKAALNARHYRALQAQRASGALNRGPLQDALTLFDEGGVIVAASDVGLAALLAEWRWKELFWRERARLRTGMSFHLFGHALCEQALRPFTGITGRGIVLEVEPDLLAAPAEERYSALDGRLADYLSAPGTLTATRDLAVVPVLGVPGWCADNERGEYYDDADYFRPARRADGQVRSCRSGRTP